MNLSVIKNLLVQSDVSLDALRYLLNCRAECEWLDFKEALNLEYNKGAADFAKDMLGMKNVGGGYVVVGVKDKTWEAVGIPSPLPYDTKMLRDKIRKCIGIDLDVLIVHHTLVIDGSTRLFAVVMVRGSQRRTKRRMPSVAKVDFCVKDPYGIRRGDIYVRRSDSTERIDSEDDLADLFDSLEEQVDQDLLTANRQASPFAVDDGTYRLLDRGFETFIGREGLREQVVEALSRDPRIWIINVHGPGGVGKSAIVNWVTYKCYKERQFEAILHLTGKDTMLTTDGIRRFSRSLYSLEDLVDQILALFQEPLHGPSETRKKLAVDYLSAWKTLLVLDNMETITDGRILTFVQTLPPTTQCKVLMTSRTKTGGWELPIPVSELSLEEVREFVHIKSTELGIPFPTDNATCVKVQTATGGLALAIQWTIGRFRIVGDLETVLSAVRSPDSPVLEFSFRNIWAALSTDARSLLAVFSVFEAPPTSQMLSIATDWNVERIETAASELAEVTLITRTARQEDGQIVFVALPITLDFARNQFNTMGDFETLCRQRLVKFSDQMSLHQSEIGRFESIFERHGIETENEKRAMILCSRGQSEMFAGSTDQAETFFRQAKELAPQSAYVFAMSASHELARNRVGAALDLARKACGMSKRKDGALAYTILARVLDVQRDRRGRVEALKKAVDFDPSDLAVRHQYGVALSQAKYTQEAITEFSKIIDEESNKPTATQTLLVALKTRIINYRRLERNDMAEIDIGRANRLLANNPHLSHLATQFMDI
jgi:tetratricopeptide (TPR) repeat protein